MRWIPLSLVLVAAATMPLALRAQEGADPTLAKVGRGYFQEHCAVCHGANGEGDGPAATALSPPPKDLTRIAQRREGKFPDGDIAMYIDGRFEVPAHGTRTMPIWGRELAPSNIDPGVAEEIVRGRILTLVEFLRSIQKTE